jgi:hypothetical protein
LASNQRKNEAWRKPQIQNPKSKIQNSRRQFLAAGAAGSLALLAGCGASSSSNLPDGEIVGQSDALGHKLQQGWRPVPSADAWQDTQVVIVGGGIAGLSAAWRLLRAGFNDFVVLELEQAPGGTSRSGRNDVSMFPWAAHYVPAPQKEDRTLVRLLTEMRVIEGTSQAGQPIVAEQFLCRDPQERIFYKGQWYEGLYLHAGADAEDQRQFAAFMQDISRWVAWRDSKGRPAFALPVAAASDDADVQALDRITMHDYLAQKGWTSPRLRWYVEYACRDDYGTLLPGTSAWAGLFYFCARVSKPGEEAEPLITWPEGNGRIADYLHAQVASRVKLAIAVTDITGAPFSPPLQGEGPGERSVQVTAFDRAAGKATGYRARRVIFAAPQFLARYLLAEYRDHPPEHIRQFEYSPWLVANLTLRDSPATPWRKTLDGRGFPVSWDNVLYESPSLGYVVATHQTDERGPTVLTWYHAFCESSAKDARALLLQGNWQHWAQVVLSDLERAHPGIRSLVTRLDLMRWGHAMVRPRPGFIFSPARRQAAQAVGNIHFAHTDLSGVALIEEALYHGVRAAEDVLTALSLKPRETFL